MYDFFGLGNAVVDAEITVDDEFLDRFELAKGQTSLVDSQQMATLVAGLEGRSPRRCAGGSAGNTTYACAAFGLSAAYNCKLTDDEGGRFFYQEMSDAGILVTPVPRNSSDGQRSGQCLVLITSDSQRTMCTDLGISAHLSVDDINASALANSSWLYVEGYLSSSESSTRTALECYSHAKRNGAKIAATLSDLSMISFFKESLQSMLGDGVDMLFANEHEALAWAKTDRLDIAIKELRDIAPEMYVTLGPAGSTAVSPEGVKTIAGVPANAVDSTGAGDIFAGAAMSARIKGAAPADAAGFANFAAAHLVARMGSRLDDIEQYRRLQASYAMS